MSTDSERTRLLQGLKKVVESLNYCVDHDGDGQGNNAYVDTPQEKQAALETCSEMIADYVKKIGKAK